MEKIHGVHKLLLQLKKSLFVLFNTAVESVNYSLLKNLKKHFWNLTYKKFSSHMMKIYRNIYRKKCLR